MLRGGQERIRPPTAAYAGCLAPVPLRCYVRCHTVAGRNLADTGAMAGAQNHLIELLPRAARRTLLAICEPVELVLSDKLYAHEAVTRYAYFPVDATISLVTPIDGKPVLE